METEPTKPSGPCAWDVDVTKSGVAIIYSCLYQFSWITQVDAERFWGRVDSTAGRWLCSDLVYKLKKQNWKRGIMRDELKQKVQQFKRR